MVSVTSIVCVITSIILMALGIVSLLMYDREDTFQTFTVMLIMSFVLMAMAIGLLVSLQIGKENDDDPPYLIWSSLILGLYGISYSIVTSTAATESPWEYDLVDYMTYVAAAPAIAGIVCPALVLSKK